MSVSHWKIQCIYWVVIYDHFDFTTFRIPSRRPGRVIKPAFSHWCVFSSIFLRFQIFSWDMKGQKNATPKIPHIYNTLTFPLQGVFVPHQLLVDVFFRGARKQPGTCTRRVRFQDFRDDLLLESGRKENNGDFFQAPKNNFTLNMTSWHLLFVDVCCFEIKKLGAQKKTDIYIHIYIYCIWLWYTLVNLQWSVFSFGKIHPLLADSKCWSLPTRLAHNLPLKHDSFWVLNTGLWCIKRPSESWKLLQITKPEVMFSPEVFHYCWWLKSCTSLQVVHPIIYGVSYIPGGAGF